MKGEHVVKLRTMVGMTRPAFAKFVGVHLNSVKNWEEEAVAISSENAKCVRERVGVWLKETRSMCGLSQRALAHIIQVAPAQVSQWEAGHKVPSAVNAEVLHLVLGPRIDCMENACVFPGCFQPKLGHTCHLCGRCRARAKVLGMLEAFTKEAPPGEDDIKALVLAWKDRQAARTYQTTEAEWLSATARAFKEVVEAQSQVRNIQGRLEKAFEREATAKDALRMCIAPHISTPQGKPQGGE